MIYLWIGWTKDKKAKSRWIKLPSIFKYLPILIRDPKPGSRIYYFNRKYWRWF